MIRQNPVDSCHFRGIHAALGHRYGEFGTAAGLGDVPICGGGEIQVCAAECGAGSQSRQQPVNAVDDLIETCPVIVLHSQHHLAGMTGDAPGHGEKTVAHR